MKQRPSAIGLSICEQVIIEEKTRNVSLVNCCTQMAVDAFPSTRPSFVVLSILTDGMGEGNLELSIQRLDTMEEVYQRNVSHKFADPLQEIRCVFRIRDCSFPVQGTYQVSVSCESEQLAQRRLRVFKKGSP